MGIDEKKVSGLLDKFQRKCVLCGELAKSEALLSITGVEKDQDEHKQLAIRYDIHSRVWGEALEILRQTFLG